LWDLLPKGLFLLGQDPYRDSKVEVTRDGLYRSEMALMGSLLSTGMCVEGPSFCYFILIINNIIK
jgi:hypothetical protein